MLFVRKNTRENNYSDLSDEALIQLYKATGKEVYVSELFQRYADKIYIIRLNAEFIILFVENRSKCTLIMCPTYCQHCLINSERN